MRNMLLYALAVAGAWYMAILFKGKGFLVLFMAAVLLPPFFLFMLWECKRKLTCGLLLSPSPDGSGEYQVCLNIENKSFFYLAGITAVVALKHAGNKRARKARLSGGISAGGDMELKKAVGRLELGVWQAECKSLICYDCLGLFRLKKKLKLQAQVMVLPSCYDTTVRVGVRTKLSLADGGRSHPQLGGDGSAEILGFREYQNGDRLNRVHWKLSARAGELLVAEMGMPIGCNVVVFLDAQPEKMRREGRTAYWEVANSISHGLLEQECPHFLVWKDGKGQKIRRKAVWDAQGLFEFWDEILKSQMERCNFLQEYPQEFRGEPYVTGIQWNQELELYCNGNFQAKMEPGKVKGQLLEVELTV